MTNFTIGMIFSEAFAMMKRNVPLFGIFVLASLLLSSLAVLGVSEFSANLIEPLGSIVIGYVFLHMLLSKENLAQGAMSLGNALAYLGVYIVAGIGMILGFVLLLVPGLFLAARWSLVTQLVVGEELSVSEALSRSWELTGPRQWTIIGYVAIVMLIGLIGATLLGGGLATFMMAGGDVAPRSSGFSLVLNLFGSIGGAFLVASGVALYRLLALGENEAEHVFG